MTSTESIASTGMPSSGSAERAPSRTRDADGAPHALAQALGWFSVGLGLAEVAAPGGVARLIGIADRADRRTWLRAFGVRELTSGAGILASGGRSGWLWSRVVGDAIDLAFLGRAFAFRDADTTRLAAATAAVAGVTALDVFCSERARRAAASGVRERKIVTINRPVEE